MNSPLVDKEDLTNYHFLNHVVLSHFKQIQERRLHFEDSLMLGNDYKQKVRIICKTTDGISEVSATIWEVADTHIELKSGKDFPIHSILEVIK